MKNILRASGLALCLLLTLGMQAKPRIERAEPLSWFTDMKMPLTLMLQGEDLADADITIQQMVNGKVMKGQCLGLTVKRQRNAESPNYLFVDLNVKETGTYRITLTKGKRSSHIDYVINARRPDAAANISYGPQDVIYLLMPDRFANGDPTNDNTDNTTEKAAPTEWFGRHGGDIKGIIDHLDAIKALGATAIWSTPLLLDNEPQQSYHGYACADYYHIDPRFGSNELYRDMVKAAHNKGLKVIMDIVPNHCGSAHWWMSDLPYHDWIHQYPTFTRSNWQFSTAADPHAAEADFTGMNSGWFDTSMPDMNLDNPDVLKYFQQWAIWWIEAMNLDGLRVDTYPYNEKEPISQWTKAVRNEYPGINIVGECWTRPTSQVAYWQADARNPDGYNSNLPCVMDFPLQEAMIAALAGNGEGWGQGMLKCYEVVAEDFLYAHPDNLLIFDSNHDTPRVRDVLLDKSIERNKLIVALLATMRGIPQLTYGEEFGLLSLNPEDVSNHGALRVNHPWFNGTAAGLTAEQEDLCAFYSKLFNWRRTSKTVHEGKLMHFLSRDNTYAYVRYTDDEAVFVYINAATEPRQIPVAHYHEILMSYQKQGTDIISGNQINLNQRITVEPLTAIIVPLGKAQ
ncbi:MAG: cyclomaltodextrinase C-terminal domain-containing protein [Paludibacteraceae bacterium]|nr:cyclomaltodextrinase C-terminal domain-containing protein [Paludibacteraceae bacterium]